MRKTLECGRLRGITWSFVCRPKWKANELNAIASARERIKLYRERMKTRYDSRGTDDHFKEGDLVWMCNPKRWRGLSPNLEQNREAPYTVVKKQSDVVYSVQRSSNAKPKVINIKRITHP
ncbi:hypothetical protein AVEN_38160-1 [Araneus ventricosus]|uniref:Integrase p58-like C-terminal domain-containing protein n=1 Tax=Araneus ventricosus TaxID=182803 RepID=A0A4Y2F596_ARAVE|nr:hypothetical protein AVEN_38160-1 [Araneus ventricosus]